MIDFHTHIIPENIPNFKEKFGYGGFVKFDKKCNDKINIFYDDDTFFRCIDCNCYNVNCRIKECEENKVKMQVISTIPVMFSYKAKPLDTLQVCQFINNHISQICIENPNKFIGLGIVPMNDISLACQELDRCINVLGLKGIEIGTHINGLNLDNEIFFPLYEKIEQLNAVIFVHPWDMLSKERMSKYWMEWLIGMPCETAIAICSIIFSDVLMKYPNLKFVFSHGGGSFFGILGRIKHGFNVRPELFGNGNINNIKKIYVDSLVHDIDMLKKIIKEIGEDNILLGTDYPFPLGELKPGQLILDSDLDSQTKEKLLWKNAMNLFNIKNL